jgi:hypothetical protein
VVAEPGDTPPLAAVVVEVVGVVDVAEVVVGVVADLVVELLAVVEEVDVEATFLGGGTGTGVGGRELALAPQPVIPRAIVASQRLGCLTAFLNVLLAGSGLSPTARPRSPCWRGARTKSLRDGGRRPADRRGADCSELLGARFTGALPGDPPLRPARG